MSENEIKENTILLAGEVEIHLEAEFMGQVFGVSKERAKEIIKQVKALHILEDLESQVILKLAEKFTSPNEFLYGVWLCGREFERMETIHSLSEGLMDWVR